MPEPIVCQVCDESVLEVELYPAIPPLDNAIEAATGGRPYEMDYGHGPVFAICHACLTEQVTAGLSDTEREFLGIS